MPSVTCPTTVSVAAAYFSTVPNGWPWPRHPTKEGRFRSAAADRWSLFFMLVLDIHMLLGLWLYLVLSPCTAKALADFGTAMRTPALRFWAVEHVSLMLLAVVLVHVGRVLARTARTPGSRR